MIIGKDDGSVIKIYNYLFKMYCEIAKKRI